jgi:CheY-like chemotaxis protein
MNVLVYDSPITVAHFIRALLLPQNHRVAFATDATEAALKLETALFDALVIGPAGAPQELADHVQREFPQLPVVLAGTARAAEAMGQVAAVLPAPLSAQKTLSTFVRLDRARENRIRQLPVEVSAEGLAIACRLADLTPETMLLAGESDEFHRYFGGGPRRIQALVAGTPVVGDVAWNENNVPHRLRRVGVRLEGSGARAVLAGLLKG